MSTLMREADPAQVADNPRLLERMMADLEAAEPIYHPTNYWKRYEQRLLPHLYQSGLRDFRHQALNPGADILDTFGAVDRITSPVVFRRLRDSKWLKPLAKTLPGRFHELADKFIRFAGQRFVSEQTVLANWRAFTYEYCRSVGELSNAEPLDRLSGSRAGNPADVFDIEGRLYTQNLLYYYLRYCFSARQLDWSSLRLYAELGSGSGKQAEVLFKLHPQLTILLFDIPPQIYVCQQYLQAIFPGKVVPYEETQTVESLSDLKPGMIYIFGNWQFPLIGSAPIDLFWNAASFAEMEPAVVENYLRYVNSTASAVYLMQVMEGREKAPALGEHGVLEPTTVDHYRKFLHKFESGFTARARRPDGECIENYKECVWKRRGM